MKKSVILFFAFLFSAPVPGLAFSPAIEAVISGTTSAGGPSCQEIPYESQTTQNDTNSVGRNTSGIWVGQTSYDYGSNRSFCRGGIWIESEMGDVTGSDWQVEVYTLSGTALNTIQGTSSSVSGATIHAMPKPYWQAFNFSTPVTLNTGTNYAIVFTRASGYDANNYLMVYSRTTDGGIHGQLGIWSQDKTQYYSDAATDACFKLHNYQ